MTELYKSFAIKAIIVALSVLGSYLHVAFGASDMTALATDLVNAAFTAWSLYRISNMKLVPHDSIAISKDNLVPNFPGNAAPGYHVPIKGDSTGAGNTMVKVVGTILFAFVIMSLAWSTPLFAQGTRKPINLDPLNVFTPAAAPASSIAGFDSLLNKFGSNIQKVEKDLADKVITDLNAAIADATTHNDAISLPCWKANLALVQNLPAEWPTPPALPVGVALSIQIQRDLLNAITSNDAGSLKVACAALWGDQIAQIGKLGLMFGFAL